MGRNGSMTSCARTSNSAKRAGTAGKKCTVRRARRFCKQTSDRRPIPANGAGDRAEPAWNALGSTRNGRTASRSSEPTKPCNGQMAEEHYGRRCATHKFVMTTTFANYRANAELTFNELRMKALRDYYATTEQLEEQRLRRELATPAEAFQHRLSAINDAGAAGVLTPGTAGRWCRARRVARAGGSDARAGLSPPGGRGRPGLSTRRPDARRVAPGREKLTTIGRRHDDG